MTLFDTSLPPFLQLRPGICLYEVFRLCKRESDYMSGFPLFLFHRAKMTTRTTEGVIRKRRPRFLLLVTLARECTFLTKSEAKERLLTVRACINNFVFSLQVCPHSSICITFSTGEETLFNNQKMS